MWMCKLRLTSIPQAWNVRFSPSQPMQGLQWDDDGLHKVLVVQGQALGRARTECRMWAARKRGLCPEGPAVCDHEVTEDKQKEFDMTGQLEMSVKSKEREEGRRRSVDYFCYHFC